MRLRNVADLTRTLWLQSNIDAALGRRKQAITGLEQVRSERVRKEIAKARTSLGPREAA